MRKAVDIVLLLALICGAIAAWKTGRERHQLSHNYARLARITGDLPIADPSKLYFVALETSEPMHYVWRIYLPPNYRFVLTSGGNGGGGGSGTSWSSGPKEFIGRVRFRESNDGRLEVYSSFAGGSSCRSIGDESLAQFLPSHWDRLQVEQLAGDGLVVVDPGKSAVILRIKVPDDLAKEGRTTLSRHAQVYLGSTLFELKLGPDSSKP